MNSTELAKKIEELMSTGLSLEAALEECKVKTTSARKREHIEDRVAYIKGLNNIVEVRKASKAAFAKRSKAKDAETENRYSDEITAARNRLNELTCLINQAEDPLAKALELGEEPSGIVQRMLDQYSGLDEELGELCKAGNIARKTAKDLMKQIPQDFIPAEIEARLTAFGPEYLDIYKARVGKNDQRCITINRMIAFRDNLKSGNMAADESEALQPTKKSKPSKK